jgi:hypothetical protein
MQEGLQVRPPPLRHFFQGGGGPLLLPTASPWPPIPCIDCQGRLERESG